MSEKNKKNYSQSIHSVNTSENQKKIKKIFRRRNPFTRLRDKIKKIKLEKIFLDSSPHGEPAQKGEGCRVKMYPHIYSAGK